MSDTPHMADTGTRAPAFSSLRSRVTLLFLAVLLLLQLSSFAVIRTSISTNVRAAVQDELVLGERVLDRLLEQNAKSLTQAMEVLAADFGFRAAVASRDRATIESALENHGARIGADLISYHDPRGITLADASPGLGNEPAQPPRNGPPLPAAMDQRLLTGNQSTRVLLHSRDGRLFQRVVLPVKAPLVIGWVVAGFEIGPDIVADLKQLTGIDATFLAYGEPLSSGARPTATLLASSLPAHERLALLDGVGEHRPAGREAFEWFLAGNDYGSTLRTLTDAADRPIVSLLQRSISDASLPYDRLQLILLLLTAAGLVLSTLVSVATAHRIARPVRELARSAHHLGQGRRQGRIMAKGYREVVELAQAFNVMSDQVAQRESRIRQLAFEDALTGLPNRTALLQAMTSSFEAGEGPAALLVLNLRRFKKVNEILGLLAADQLLQQVAGRLRAGLDDDLADGSQVLARTGGDEFSVYIRSASEASALQLAERVRALLAAPQQYQGTAIDLHPAIGIALSPAHAHDAESMLIRCQMAMQAAKQEPALVRIYDQKLDAGSEESLSMISEIRQAIQDGQFRLFYQPKVRLPEGRVLGAEALVRWQHPSRGFIAPDRFIPFAEATGVITEISDWVLQEAIAQIARWNSAGRHLVISANLSTRDLLDRHLPARIEEILRRQAVSPGQLCLEITESAIMDDADRALETLHALRRAGLGLSIDDFGTGYSSLAYLKQMPVNEIKIDRSFVMNMLAQDSDLQIVRSTINLGHQLGFKIVAEGVEDAKIVEALAGLGCDLAQGYFVGKPMDAPTFTAWLRSWAGLRHSTTPTADSKLIDATKP